MSSLIDKEKKSVIIGGIIGSIIGSIIGLFLLVAAVIVSSVTISNMSK